MDTKLEVNKAVKTNDVPSENKGAGQADSFLSVLGKSKDEPVKNRMKMKVQKMHEHATLPEFKREGDAAMDLYSCEDVLLKSGEQLIVKTGIKMAIPKDHVGLIWDRSGLAAKSHLHTMAGVIDSNYRGEIGIVLRNLGKNDFNVTKGTRIAQMVIQPILSPHIEETKELDETVRGEAGFGSTGMK